MVWYVRTCQVFILCGIGTLYTWIVSYSLRVVRCGSASAKQSTKHLYSNCAWLKVVYTQSETYTPNSRYGNQRLSLSQTNQVLGQTLANQLVEGRRGWELDLPSGPVRWKDPWREFILNSLHLQTTTTLYCRCFGLRTFFSTNLNTCLWPLFAETNSHLPAYATRIRIYIVLVYRAARFTKYRLAFHSLSLHVYHCM